MAKKEEEVVVETLLQRLAKVQTILSVPKERNNDFGGYRYRSAEDILAKGKPLCVAQGLLLTLSDSIELVGDRFYVKATATVTDTKTGENFSVSAYAREASAKRGMDESQVTGSTSTYARKYALNGLFGIDDTKDADTNEFHNENEKLQEQADKLEVELKGYRDNLFNASNLLNIAPADMKKIINAKTGKSSSTQLSINELNDLTMNLESYAVEVLGGSQV